MVIAMDAIGERADQMSDLLAKFSVLFAGSIQETSDIIRRNGLDRMRYTKRDREVLATCVNLAGAVKTVLDVPILNNEGKLTAASAKVIQESKKRMREIENVMKG